MTSNYYSLSVNFYVYLGQELKNLHNEILYHFQKIYPVKNSNCKNKKLLQGEAHLLNILIIIKK